MLCIIALLLYEDFLLATIGGGIDNKISLNKDE
jgi:hypothetical protein